MEFRVFYKHMPASEALSAHAQGKIDDCLKKYNLGIVDVHVTFSVDPEGHHAHCVVAASQGATIVVDARDEISMYAAVDRLTGALDGKLRKAKEKRRSHRLGAPIDLVPLKVVREAVSGPAIEPIDADELLRQEQARVGAQL